jgi:hypothetical protein
VEVQFMVMFWSGKSLNFVPVKSLGVLQVGSSRFGKFRCKLKLLCWAAFRKATKSQSQWIELPTKSLRIYKEYVRLYNTIIFIYTAVREPWFWKEISIKQSALYLDIRWRS